MINNSNKAFLVIGVKANQKDHVHHRFTLVGGPHAGADLELNLTKLDASRRGGATGHRLGIAIASCFVNRGQVGTLVKKRTI